MEFLSRPSDRPRYRGGRVFTVQKLAFIMTVEARSLESHRSHNAQADPPETRQGYCRPGWFGPPRAGGGPVAWSAMALPILGRLGYTLESEFQCAANASLIQIPAQPY
jgi:hypothetical protein